MAGFSERWNVNLPDDPVERERLIMALRFQNRIDPRTPYSPKTGGFTTPPGADWEVTPEPAAKTSGWTDKPTGRAASTNWEWETERSPYDPPHEVAGARNQASPEDVAAVQGPPKKDWQLQVEKIAQQQTAAEERRARQGTISQPEAAGRGLHQGGSLGWGEEIGGLQEASGLPRLPSERLPTPTGRLMSAARAVVGGGRILAEKLGLPGEAGKRYDDYVNAERERNAEASSQHPRTYTGSEIAGGLAVPVPGASATKVVGTTGQLAPAFGKRILGAVTQGSIAGAGQGEGAAGKTVGAGVGAGIGAVAPAVHWYIHPVTGRLVNAVRNWANPQGAAERAIGTALRSNEAAAADRAAQGWRAPAISEAELGQQWSRAGGQPSVGGIVTADVLGPPGATLTRAAANEPSGAARRTIEDTLIPRKEIAGQRVAGQIDESFTQPSARQARRDITAESRSDISPLYQKAYAAGQGDLTTKAPALTAMSMNSPYIQRAEKSATEALQSRYAAEGRKWHGLRDAEYWDQVKRKLDDRHEQLIAKPGNAEEASVVDMQRKALIKRMDKVVPGYREAREGGSEIAGARTAVGMGEQTAKRNISSEELRAKVAGLPEEERQLFVEGYLTHVKDLLGGAGRGSVENGIGKLRSLQAIPGALNQREAAEVAKIVRQRQTMAATEREALTGSTTARQLNSKDLVSVAGAGLGGYGAYSDSQDRGSTFYGSTLLTAGGLARLLMGRMPQGTSPAIAQRIAQGLMSQDPATINAAREAMRKAEQWRARRGAVGARVSRQLAGDAGGNLGGEQR